MADGPLMSSTYPYGGSGYTCSVCGAYVAYGYSHASCRGYRPATGGNEVKWDRMSDVRIADALEHIATHLVELTEIVHKVVEKLALEEHFTDKDSR